ncbi:hypothetical protein OSTOST_08687 [Ostertagia ostertagi]
MPRQGSNFPKCRRPYRRRVLPFLIFFRDKENKEHDKLFIDAVVRELYGTRMTINPLLADGRVFAHPLQHLGKTFQDLPVLAIDSFVHMFVFPNISELSKPGVLKQISSDVPESVFKELRPSEKRYSLLQKTEL